MFRPVLPQDYDWLYALDTDPQHAFRWRHLGRTPSPEESLRSLWDGVLAQYLVVQRDTGERVGLVTAYNANLRDGYAHIAVLEAPHFRGSALAMEGILLFIDYLWRHWNFRKLYAESLEYNLQQFASGANRYFAIEGRLREHTYYDGRYWDKLYLAVYRADWPARGGRLLRYILGEAET